jgi:membrane protease subunit HflK
MDEVGESSWKDMLLAGARNLPYRNRRFVAILILIAIGIYFLTGIYAIQPQEQGVVIRFGKVARKGVPPGIHYRLPYPFEKVYKPKTAEIKKAFINEKGGGIRNAPPGTGLEMLTGDTNVILVQMIVQYAISDPVAYLFATEDAKRLVEAAAEEAMTRIVGAMGVDDLLTTEKLMAQDLMKQRIQDVLDSYNAGIETIGAYFQEISPPVEVAYAFRDVASAREDKNRLINEAEGYMNAILPTTRGEAERMVREAEGFSQERVDRATGEAERFLSLYGEYKRSKSITASRIYMEKMEKVLPKLRIYMVDNSSGQGLTSLRLMMPSKTK